VTGCDNSDTKFVTDKAPYIKDVITKIKEKTNSRDKFVRFIKDYINHPDRKKSLYGKKAIKEFGLMPALNGVMTDKETTQLANYLYDMPADKN